MKKMRFIGDKWPPTAKVTADLDPTVPLTDQRPTILAALGIDDAAFGNYNVHKVVDMKVGDVVDQSKSIDELDLKSPYLWLRGRIGAAAAAKAPPSKGGGASPKKVPPPSAAASKAPQKGAPPPPPPKKSVQPKAPPSAPPKTPPHATESQPPPPPPPKKSASPKKAPPAAPVAAAAKKSSSVQQPASASASQGSESETSSATAAPPPPPPKKAVVKKSPASMPHSDGAAAAATTPPPPPPKKSVIAKSTTTATSAAAAPIPTRQPPQAKSSKSPRPPPSATSSPPPTAATSSPPSSVQQQRQPPVGKAPVQSKSTSARHHVAAATGGSSSRMMPQTQQTGFGGRHDDHSDASSSEEEEEDEEDEEPPRGDTKHHPHHHSSKTKHTSSKHHHHHQNHHHRRHSSRSSDSDGSDRSSNSNDDSADNKTQNSFAVEALKALREDSKQQLSQMREVFEDKFQSLQKAMLEEERLRVDRAEGNLSTQVNNMKLHLEEQWEAQKSSVIRQQNELETMRADMLRKLVDREEQIQAAQADVIKRYQHRASGNVTGQTAIDDLRAQNAQLREAIKIRSEAASDGDGAGGGVTNADLQALVQLQTQLVDSMKDLKAMNISSHAMATSASTSSGGVSPQGSGGRGGELDYSMHSPVRGVIDGTALIREDELKRCLCAIGLEKYVPALLQHEVDLRALSAMSEQEMQHVGIATVGARKRLQLELHRRRRNASTLGDDAGTDDDDGQNQHWRNTSGLFGETSAINMSTATTSVNISTNNNNTSALLKSNPDLQLHIDLLKDFYRNYAPELCPRAAITITAFADRLEVLYTALCRKYDVFQRPYRIALMRFFRDFGHPSLIPAVDVVCDIFKDREAEYCEFVELSKLGISSNPLTWMAYTTEEYTYYYSSLVNVSQWEMPESIQADRIVEVKETRYTSSVKTGSNNNNNNNSNNNTDSSSRELPPNPLADEHHQTESHLYVSAVVSMLMHHDPQRLAQIPSIMREYKGRESEMYSNLVQLYGVQQPGSSSSGSFKK